MDKLSMCKCNSKYQMQSDTYREYGLISLIVNIIIYNLVFVSYIVGHD